MFRSAVVLLLLAGCTSPAATTPTAPDSTTALDSATVAAATKLTRRHISADLYHYQLDLRVGATPNAIVRVHRDRKSVV